MKSISYWAGRHLCTAPLLVVAGHVLLTLLAVFVGKPLMDLRISLPYYPIYVWILCLAAARVLHPGGHCSNPYTQRKWCEGSGGYH